MKIKQVKVIALALMLAFGIAACDKPNSAEKAGKAIDQAAENAGKNIDQATSKLTDQAVKTSAVIEDSSITARVKNAIMAESGLKVLKINVDTVGGVATLTGIVKSRDVSDLATKVVGAVSDVKKVDNRLVVRLPQ